MVASLLVAVLAAAPPSGPVLKIAAPGLRGVDVSAERATFVNDYFAEQLTRAGQGRFSLMTESQVSAVLGFERQKQLLGCADDGSSCVMEIGGALGADALIVGNVAKFADTYAVTLKVISARDGSALASAARSGLPEKELLDWVTEAANAMARQLDPSLGPVPAAPSAAAGPHDNELRLSLLCIDYARLLHPRFSIGARAGFTLMWDFTGEVRAAGSLSAIARYAVVPFDGGWFANAYVTAGGALGDQVPGPTMDGFAWSAGAEGGYRWVQGSLELFRVGQVWTLAPGLAGVIRF